MLHKKKILYLCQGIRIKNSNIIIKHSKNSKNSIPTSFRISRISNIQNERITAIKYMNVD